MGGPISFGYKALWILVTHMVSWMKCALVMKIKNCLFTCYTSIWTMMWVQAWVPPPICTMKGSICLTYAPWLVNISSSAWYCSSDEQWRGYRTHNTQCADWCGFWSLDAHNQTLMAEDGHLCYSPGEYLQQTANFAYNYP